VKAASDVYAPVSGEVTEGNQAVRRRPALVNTTPEGAGWFFKLKLSDPGELDASWTKRRTASSWGRFESRAPASTSKWNAADYAKIGAFRRGISAAPRWTCSTRSRASGSSMSAAARGR
jgi:hypothetical protein